MLLCKLMTEAIRNSHLYTVVGRLPFDGLRSPTAASPFGWSAGKPAEHSLPPLRASPAVYFWWAKSLQYELHMLDRVTTYFKLIHIHLSLDLYEPMVIYCQGGVNQKPFEFSTSHIRLGHTRTPLVSHRELHVFFFCGNRPFPWHFLSFCIRCRSAVGIILGNNSKRIYRILDK